MSALVSSFDRTKIGDFDYLFFVVTWADYVTPITEQINTQVDPFGSDLGLKGMVVRAFNTASYETASEVTTKDWPKEIRERFEMEQDPFMVIINKDFHEFDPKKHPWSIIWFSEYENNPDRIYKIFGQLARKTRKGENIFQYLHSIASKKKLSKWNKYFEIKPELYGVSIDVKAIFEDVMGIGNDP